MRPPREGARIMAGDGDPRHGSLNGYSNLKCNCDECRREWARYCADRTRDRPQIESDDPRHGLYTTYDNWKCHCGPCTVAHRQMNRVWRAARVARGGKP